LWYDTAVSFLCLLWDNECGLLYVIIICKYIEKLIKESTRYERDYIFNREYLPNDSETGP